MPKLDGMIHAGGEKEIILWAPGEIENIRRVTAINAERLCDENCRRVAFT